MRYDNMSDFEVIQEVLRDNKDLYRILTTRYRREIYLRASRALPGRANVDDAVQETFVRAYFRLKDFRADGNFRSWLCGILRNVVGDTYRKTARAKETSLEELGDFVLALSEQASVPAPDERFSEFLNRCMERLSEKSRQVFELRHLSGKSGKEIGKLFGQTQGATNAALMRIRRNLRECIETNLRQGDERDAV